MHSITLKQSAERYNTGIGEGTHTSYEPNLDQLSSIQVSAPASPKMFYPTLASFMYFVMWFGECSCCSLFSRWYISAFDSIDSFHG